MKISTYPELDPVISDELNFFMFSQLDLLEQNHSRELEGILADFKPGDQGYRLMLDGAAKQYSDARAALNFETDAYARITSANPWRELVLGSLTDRIQLAVNAVNESHQAVNNRFLVRKTASFEIASQGISALESYFGDQMNSVKFGLVIPKQSVDDRKPTSSVYYQTKLKFARRQSEIENSGVRRLLSFNRGLLAFYDLCNGPSLVELNKTPIPIDFVYTALGRSIVDSAGHFNYGLSHNK